MTNYSLMHALPRIAEQASRPRLPDGRPDFAIAQSAPEAKARYAVSRRSRAEGQA